MIEFDVCTVRIKPTNNKLSIETLTYDYPILVLLVISDGV